MRSLLGSLFNRAPVPYVSRYSSILTGGRGPSDEANMRAYTENSTLFAIVSRTMEAVSSVDWHLYRKADSGLKDDRSLVTRHAALDLWERPNPFYSRQALVEASTQHLTLTGKATWVLYRLSPSSPPLEIWPVRPDRVTPVKSHEKFMTGWTYRLGSEEVPLRLDEVIRQTMPHPLDPYEGAGAVQALGTDLDASRLAGEWNRNFFLNSALPGGIAEVDRRLSDDEFKELTTRWEEQHRGVARAHRVAILENGLKWVERKYTRRDMEFSAQRGDTREAIREAFGFPKAMLGSVDDVNRANAEANEVMFARWLVVPRLARIKGALNGSLLPMFGSDVPRRFEFDHDNPTPADVALENETLLAKVDAAVKLVAAGWEPAAALEMVGLPPMPYTGKPGASTRKDFELAAMAVGNGHALTR